MSMYLNAAETVFSVASVTNVTSDRMLCVRFLCVFDFDPSIPAAAAEVQQQQQQQQQQQHTCSS